jgi:hypothetical protein
VVPPATFGPYLTDLLDLDARARDGRLLVATHAGRVAGTVTYHSDAAAEGLGCAGLGRPARPRGRPGGPRPPGSGSRPTGSTSPERRNEVARETLYLADPAASGEPRAGSLAPYGRGRERVQDHEPPRGAGA